MGNSSSTTSKACTEALLCFDTVEVETLKEKFRETASLQGGGGKEISAAVLTQALGLGSTLGGRLFRGLVAAASAQEGAGKGKWREFWLSVMLDDGRLTKQGLTEFFTEEVALALPKGASEGLKHTLISESVANALEEGARAGTSAGFLDAEAAERWLGGQQKVEAFFSDILSFKFLRMRGAGAASGGKKMPKLARKSGLLREEHLWTLASHLPASCIVTPWKLLFSSARHGKSFSRFMSKIIFKGPTVVVVKDKGGYSFGLFAAVSWRKANKFYGESSSFVFSLHPKCKVYQSSSVNQNFQFLSTSLTSCANGLGMGGQMDFWGIHLGHMLEEGVCRAPCSTFAQMPCLSSEPDFIIDQVEVWGCVADYVADEKELEAAGVKKRHKKTLDEYERSKTCLEGDVEAQAILDAAGRTNYSADIRVADAVAEKERLALNGGVDTREDSSSSEDLEYDD